MGGILVAIDGPAGSGKSSVAQAVAGRLGVVNLNTGAAYRAAALLALREGVDLADGEGLAALARGLCGGIEDLGPRPTQGGLAPRPAGRGRESESRGGRCRRGKGHRYRRPS